MSSFMSQPKGGSDVQDALIATQRGPNYDSDTISVNPKLKKSQVNNISDYVEHNLGKNVQKRFEEHR